MEKPRVIYAGQDEFDGYAYWFHVPQEQHHDCPKYIRADLVGKLEDYVSHSRDCRKLRSFKNPCTCGLTELLGDMNG